MTPAQARAALGLSVEAMARLVGEAYRREDGIIKWHCKTSDMRNTDAVTIEQAKAECEAEYWREMVRRFQDELKAGKL